MLFNTSVVPRYLQSLVESFTLNSNKLNNWDLDPLYLLNGLALGCYQPFPEVLIVQDELYYMHRVVVFFPILHNPITYRKEKCASVGHANTQLWMPLEGRSSKTHPSIVSIPLRVTWETGYTTLKNTFHNCGCILY